MGMNLKKKLKSMGLDETIQEDYKPPLDQAGKAKYEVDKAKALVMLRHHLDAGLKYEYLTERDPLELWKGLKERYDN